MKQQLIKTTALAILTTGLIFSCKKKETTPETPSTPSATGASTTGGTTTGGTTGGSSGLQNNQWSANGTVYTATNIPNNPFWEKAANGTSVLSAKTIVGDTTIIVAYSFPSYLMNSGSYTIVPSSASYAPNTVNVGIAKSFSTSPYFIYNYVTTGGTAIITNAGGIFTIESANVGLNNMSLSSKLVSTTPVIPPANASYTAPVGITPNQFTFGSTTFTPTQLVVTLDASSSFKFEGSSTSAPFFGLKYWFSTSYPPTGTYDVVASKSALAAGKIYIEYANTTTTEVYNSLAGSKATVITNASDVSVTINNVVMNKVIGAGSQTVTVSGNLSH
jgi:hypothetical protein